MKTNAKTQFGFLEYISQPVVIFTQKGAIVTCNESFADIVSLPKDKLLQMTVREVFANATSLFDAMIQQKDALPVTIAQLNINNSNTVLAGTLIRIDDDYCFIAQQKEDDIHKLFALLQTILNAIPRMIVVLDEAGNIVMANREWVAFLSSVLQKEVDYNDYIHKNFFSFCAQLQCFDHEFHELLDESVRKVLNNQSQTVLFENSFRVGAISNWYRFVISRYTLNGYVYCVLMINDISEQKLYLDKIQEQRDTFQKYIDIAPYMVVVLNSSGTITLVNQKTCSIMGYSSDELIGKNWFEMCVPAEIQEQVYGAFRQIIKGELKPVEFYENPVVTKDGQLKLISWHNTVLTDDSGTIIGTISSGEDITKQKQMEIELLKSTTNLKAIVKAFPDFYVITDRDGFIYDYQFGDKIKLYVMPEEIIGKRFKDILPEHIAKLYANALEESFNTNTIIGVEYSIEINQETRWREARLVPMMGDRVLAVIRDVTERKEAEIALAQSEKRYRHLVNRIPAAVVEMNNTGYIVFVNQFFEQLTGYTLENLKGTHWFRSILHPHEDKHKIRQFVEMIQRGDVSNYEIRIINKEGKDTYISITTSNVYTAMGKLEKIVCIATDITPIINMREQLKDLAIKDELTGLYNRRGFIMLAEQQLKLNKRSGKGSAMFYVDMDNMKTINDTMGHHEGDKALIDVAGILRLSFRDSDIIARLGGDEFAVFAIDCEREYMELMQQRLTDNIKEFNAKNLRQYEISLSIGTVFIGDSSMDLNEIIVLADSKMYKHKLERKKNWM